MFSMSKMNQQKSTKLRIANYIEDKYKGVPKSMFETGSSLSYCPHIWGWTPAFLNILLHVSMASKMDSDDSPSNTGS